MEELFQAQIKQKKQKKINKEGKSNKVRPQLEKNIVQGEQIKKKPKNRKNIKEIKPQIKQEITTIPNIIKCLTRDSLEQEESNLEDYINKVYEPDIKQTTQIQSFAHEDDQGNIQYKLKLINPTQDRIEHLTTQMKFRLNQGYGEAYYRIGVQDNGKPTGLFKDDMLNSLKTICKIAQKIKADVIILKITQGIKGKITQLMVRKANLQGVKLEIRMLLFGQSSSGKSTLLGVLKSGQKDNGKGFARMKVFTHKHEIMSGITQSVSHQVIGFDSNGKIYNQSVISSWQNLLDLSTKILTFIDVGGHKKAQKQVISSLCSFFPQYALLVLSALNPKILPQHIQLAAIFNIPVIIVITHIDVASQQIIHDAIIATKQNLKQIYPEKTPIVIKTMQNAVLLSRTVATEAVTPIFLISNVTGKNLDIFTSFLNLLPAVSDLRNNSDMHTQFLITDKYVIENKIILAGTVIKGNIKKNQLLHLGPDTKGNFFPVQIMNVRCIRVQVTHAKCGQTCTVAIRPLIYTKQWLQKQPNAIRRGMILIQSKTDPKAAYQFQAQIKLYSKEQQVSITNKYQPVVNSLTTRQICQIVIMQKQQQQLKPLSLTKKKSKSISGRITIKQSILGKGLGVNHKLKSKQSCDFSADEHLDKSNIHEKKIIKKTNLQEIFQQGKRKKKEKQEIIIYPNKTQYLRLRFKYNPEYITVGQRLIINDELLKAVGRITQIYY